MGDQRAPYASIDDIGARFLRSRWILGLASAAILALLVLVSWPRRRAKHSTNGCHGRTPMTAQPGGHKLFKALMRSVWGASTVSCIISGVRSIRTDTCWRSSCRAGVFAKAAIWTLLVPAPPA